MKDFDADRRKRAERDRTFQIGGHEFVYRPAVAPEALLRWSQMTGGEFNLKDEAGKPVVDKDGDPISTLTEEDAIAIYDDTIVAFLEAGQEEKWKLVRDPNAPNPINVGDMTDLIRWLFEEQSGRPTSQSSGSSSGSGNDETGTSSKVASSSPVAVPATA